MFGLQPQQPVFLAILTVAFVLLITEKLRNDVVAVLIILALSGSGILKPEEALAGFGSEAAIVVAGIFVVSGGIHASGLSEMLGHRIGRLAGGGFTRPIAVIMPTVALLSAFTHHVTTTAIMLPVTLKLAREGGAAPSKLLMPLSFAASLGTTITIIGAPAFLIASQILQQNGRPGLGIFSVAPIGLALSAAGTLFVLTVGRVLLPDRRGGEEADNRFRLDRYFTELTVLPDSPFRDRTVAEVEADPGYQFDLVARVREGRRARTRPEDRLREGDVLLVRTSPEQLVAARQDSGVELSPVQQYGAETPGPDGEVEDIAEQLVQVIVAPDSDLTGRTIAEVDFRRQYGVLVVALWRRSALLHEELARIRLRAGDVLVLQGDAETIGRVAQDRRFLMMVPFQGEASSRRKAPIAGAVMLATIALAASGLLSIEIAALAGAAAMVLSRAISSRQAYRAIDQRIYVFIAGAIPLGAAMEKTQTSQLMAGWLQAALGGLSVFVILIILYAVVAILTQFMSDSATTAVFAPVAAALAHGLGRAPEAFVVTVAMASVAAFRAIGHHGNLLVYGPGRYTFSDFVKVGTPLTILSGLIVAALAPLVWPG